MGRYERITRIMPVRNGDRIIQILQEIVETPGISKTSKELAEYILEDSDFTNKINRPSSLMFICQRIFESHPEALIQMNKMILEPLIREGFKK